MIPPLKYRSLGTEYLILQGIDIILQGDDSNTTVIDAPADMLVEAFGMGGIGEGQFGIRGEYVSGNEEPIVGEYATIDLPSPPALPITLSFQLASGAPPEDEPANGANTAGKLSNGVSFGSSIIPLLTLTNQTDAGNNFIGYNYSYSNNQFALLVKSK